MEISKTFTQEFRGYWRDINKKDIPKKPGIYFVYVGTYHPLEEALSIDKLIYIGEADDVNHRLNEKHEKREFWLPHVKKGNELCFGFTEVTELEYKSRIEAAYIHYHKPKENTENVDYFRHYETTVITNTDKKQTKLNLKFTVYRKEK